jgi:RNA polymerase sigma-70 factor, ECF subfamily
LQSDNELVRSVLGGNRQAFAQLVERYEHAVFAVAMKVLGDRDAAADAAQNAFVAAYGKLGRLRDGHAFGGWLMVIARREALDAARTRPRMIPLPLGDYPACETADDGLDEKLRELKDAVFLLPDHEQRVVMLRYFDSYPVADIARITGRSASTVTKQISRALSRLRKKLGEP